jgi:putative membrane protein
MKNLTKSLFALIAAMSFSHAYAAPATTTMATVGDAEILDAMKTANTAEIDAAKIAEKKASKSEVKDFAKMMIKEHKGNLNTAMTVGKQASLTPAGNETSTAIKTDADTKLGTLKSTAAKSTEFDKTYIDQQVAMHQDLLNKLNDTFIPNAKSAPLKSYLETTKTHVEEHLAKATSIRDSLNQ